MTNENDDSGPQRFRGKWRPMILVAGAVAIWGLLLAVGAYLQPGADRPEHDPRKFWLVLGCVGGFLGIWGLALWLRSRRRD